MKSIVEEWDIYDGDGNFLHRTVAKGEKLNAGEFHLFADIWVINREGKILLTKRSSENSTSPGKWENTGGAVLSGESSVCGAIRELWEETGISVSESDLIFLGEYKYGDTAAHIFLYVSDSDRIKVRLCPSETDDYIWKDIDEVKKMISDGMMDPNITDKFLFAEEKLRKHIQSAK